MVRRVRDIFADIFLQTPGWVLLVCGLATAGVILLVPPFLECHQLAWQRDLMRLQVQRMGEQEQAYRQFLDNLRGGDPILLERLAYHYLRQKPAGTNLVNNQIIRNGQWNRALFVRYENPAAAVGGGPFAAEAFSTVDQWLQRPMPKVGVDVPAYQPFESRLTKLATGPSRVMFLSMGLGAVLLGLIPIARRQSWSRVVRGPAPSGLPPESATIIRPAPLCPALSSGTIPPATPTSLALRPTPEPVAPTDAPPAASIVAPSPAPAAMAGAASALAIHPTPSGPASATSSIPAAMPDPAATRQGPVVPAYRSPPPPPGDGQSIAAPPPDAARDPRP